MKPFDLDMYKNTYRKKVPFCSPDEDYFEGLNQKIIQRVHTRAKKRRLFSVVSIVAGLIIAFWFVFPDSFHEQQTKSSDLDKNIVSLIDDMREEELEVFLSYEINEYDMVYYLSEE